MKMRVLVALFAVTMVLGCGKQAVKDSGSAGAGGAASAQERNRAAMAGSGDAAGGQSDGASGSGDSAQGGVAGDSATGTGVPAKVAEAQPLEGAGVAPATGGSDTAGAAGSTEGKGVVPDGSVAALAERSIFFDFDMYDVKPDFKPLIEAHAKFLTEHQDAHAIIQGNTDERGSSEYNLALGQRRAEAVRKRLNVLGVPDSQIEAISFGKEKPRNAGHDEAAWAENRRADIVYKGEQ